MFASALPQYTYIILSCKNRLIQILQKSQFTGSSLPEVFLRRRYTVKYFFELFHEAQFNVYFITFKLISWNSYKICKKETSAIKKKGIQRKPEACNVIKNKTLAQVFSCDFCEISKNTFFTEHLWTTASTG